MCTCRQGGEKLESRDRDDSVGAAQLEPRCLAQTVSHENGNLSISAVMLECCSCSAVTQDALLSSLYTAVFSLHTQLLDARSSSYSDA